MEVLRFARFENATQIVIGRSRNGFFSELFRRSLPHELIRRAEGIAIHLITRDTEQPVQAPSLRRPEALRFAPLPFFYAAVAVAVALVVGELLTQITPLPNLSMVFLLAILVVAISFGVWPAIFASILSFFVYNFFFIPPFYNFTIAEPYELLALVIFLVVSVVSATLAGRVREQARNSTKRMRAMRRLYEFTRRLSGLATLDSIAEGAAGEIHASLTRATVVLLSEGSDLTLIAAWPPEDTFDAAAMTAARWTFNHKEPAGTNTSTLPNIPWYFVPLRIGEKSIGVVGIARDKQALPLDSEGRALLDTLVEQTGAALERAALAREMISARTATETERVHNTLLASVSHDFRTPLASILGAATSLIEFGNSLDPSAQEDLLGQIKTEAEDLDEMVRNLLAITRIDSGALEPRRDWVDLKEVIERVVIAAQRHGARQQIEAMLPESLPLVRADATLIEQAIGNVVGNAVVHTSPETHIRIDASVASDAVTLRVTDDGPGISAGTLKHIFDKFVTGNERRSSGADDGKGTGLGLAIAKGIMEAHAGSISAESPIAGGLGTRFTMIFPREEKSA